MRTLRRGPAIFVASSMLCGFIVTGHSAWAQGQSQSQGQGQSRQVIPPGPPMSPAATAPPAPIYRIVGYERREEALFKPSEFRAVLGPAGYRQWVASRVLLIIGGVAAFSGAVALLATLGSLGQNTDYGSSAQPGYAGAYRSYVNGFSALLAAGGGMVVTGLVLSLPLAPRRRTLFVPQLQVVESPRF